MSSSTATESRRRRRLGAFALVVGVATSFAAPSFAQSPTREAAAQALFDEGTTLFARADYEHACEKFRASNELDPKGGTLLNLALCREKQGRTASAWATFSEARNRSLMEGRNERVAFADKKIAELKPLLPTLRVVVAATAPGLEVKVDDEALPQAAWSTSVPIDPGEHRVDATAPDRQPAKLTVRLTASKETTVTVPELARLAPRATPQPLASSPPPVAAAPPRWPAWALVGGGVVFVGVGSIFGVEAFSKRSDAESLCRASRCDEGHAANDTAMRSAWIADVGIGLGVIALAAGTWFLLRSPTPPTTATLSGPSFRW